MNEAERYMLRSLASGGERDIGEIRERLKDGERAPRRAYNRSAAAAGGNNAVTSKLGRYRTVVIRKKQLDVRIREKLAFYKRARNEAGAGPSWFRRGRAENELLEMIRQSVLLAHKADESERLLARLEGGVQKAAYLRYFDPSFKAMPDWGKVAELSGFKGSGAELRAAVTKAVSECSEMLIDCSK